MAMRATIIGFGQLTQKIRIMNGLDYDREEYSDVPDGKLMNSSFFSCPTASLSMDLAQALGIVAYDFNEHIFSKEQKPDLDNIGTRLALEEIVNRAGLDETDSTINTFFECYNSGWIFIFRPNY